MFFRSACSHLIFPDVIACLTFFSWRRFKLFPPVLHFLARVLRLVVCGESDYRPRPSRTTARADRSSHGSYFFENLPKRSCAACDNKYPWRWVPRRVENVGVHGENVINLEWCIQAGTEAIYQHTRGCSSLFKFVMRRTCALFYSRPLYNNNRVTSGERKKRFYLLEVFHTFYH